MLRCGHFDFAACCYSRAVVRGYKWEELRLACKQRKLKRSNNRSAMRSNYFVMHQMACPLSRSGAKFHTIALVGRTLIMHQQNSRRTCHLDLYPSNDMQQPPLPLPPPLFQRMRLRWVLFHASCLPCWEIVHGTLCTAQLLNGLQ